MRSQIIPAEPGCYGLIGPNGSGKTTLLRKIAGHIPHTAYESDQEVAFARTAVECRGAGRRINNHLAVAGLGAPGADKAQATALLESFGIAGNPRLSELSVGQRQVLSDVVALSTSASLYLFDEPFSGLDSPTRATLRSQFLELMRNRPEARIIMSSHRAEDLIGLCTSFILMTGFQPIVISDPTECAHHFPCLSGTQGAFDAIPSSLQLLKEKHLGRLEHRLYYSPSVDYQLSAQLEEEGLSLHYPQEKELIDILMSHPHVLGGK